MTLAGPDLGELVPWVKQHSRVSVHTLRRRFRLSRVEAEALTAALVGMRVLCSQPEGESYRVRYGARAAQLTNPYRAYATITEVVRTTRERGELPVREAAEVA